MTITPIEPERKRRPLGWLEGAIEVFLFASRWVLAPFYVLMVAALIGIGVKFVQEMWALMSNIIDSEPNEVVLGILSLLDLVLLANLVLIVIFAGYETFVSKINAANGSEDRPHWMGHVDFSGLKMKLISSIVAISVIGLLQDFTNIESFDPKLESWRIALHITFIFSGVMFALMDWLGEKRMSLTLKAQVKHE
jgi:uncharacterized protein (TIGR00645 family)